MTDSPDRFRASLPARPSPVAAPAPVVSAEVYEDYAEPKAPSTKRVSPRLLWRAFRRHWWQAMLLWVVGSLGLATLAYYKVKPTYDAFARIRLEPADQGPFGRGGNATGFSEFKETQVMMMTNPVVLSLATTMRPDLLNLPLLHGGGVDPEAEIRRVLTAQVIPKTNLIQVSMSSPVPTEAAAIVNAVVDAYLKNSQSINDVETERRIRHTKELLEEHERIVKNRRDLVQSLREKLGSADTSSVKDRNSITLEEFRQFNQRLTEVELKRIAATARLDELRNEKVGPGQMADPEQIEEEVRNEFYMDPRVAKLQAEREMAEVKMASAKHISRNPSADPAYQAQKRLYDAKTRLIDGLWSSLEKPIRHRVLAQYGAGDTTDRQIAEAERELASLRSQEEALGAKLARMNVESRNSGADALSLEFARNDLIRAEAVRDRIQENLQELEYKSKGLIAQIECEFHAKPSIRPNTNHRMKAMAASPVATGLMVMALLALLELRGGRVADPDELPSRVRLQVLGVVPPLPQLRSSSGAVPATRQDYRAQRQLDEFVQSLDHLRVALCARPDPTGRDRHCVLITSACGSEGKTTLAAQLAERCVNAGLMTLLIDGDLRNPTLSRMLDADARPGLINVLRDELAPEDAIMVVGDAGGFHFLPAGTPRLDPSRLLQGDRLGRLLAQARESFEMIIVDAPPVLPVPDALTIGRWTDGAVLAVRYDTSRIPLVERANRRLAHVGIPVIGAVVNGVRTSDSSYGYGGYYAYGTGAAAEASAVGEG